MKLLLLLITLLSLTSCINDAWIGRKVRKATAERTLGYLQANHSELFKQRIDTIRDTVRIQTVRLDTVVTLQTLRLTDTITVTKDRVKTRIVLKHDSLFITSECLGDTIYIDRVITTQLPAIDYTKPYDWSWIGYIAVLLACLYLISKFSDNKSPD